MRALPQRIEREEAHAGRHRLLDSARRDVQREQPVQSSQGQLSQSLPLGGDPIVEGRLVEAEALEQLAPIQGDRFMKRVARALLHAALEGRDVDGDRLARQRDRLALQPERRRTDLDRAPQGEQRLAKIVARMLVRGPRPQQPGQRLS